MYDSSELMATLVSGMEDISKINDIKEINSRIEKLIMDLTHSDNAEFLLFDKMGKNLESKGEKPIKLDINEAGGILGQTLSSMKPVFYNHIRSEKSYDEAVDNPSEMKLKAQLLYPIQEEGKDLGVLRVSRSIKVSKNYTQNDITLFNSMESYLIKIIHILNNDLKKMDNVDQKQVGEKIQQLEKNTKEINSEVNDTLLFLSNTVHDIRTPANSLYGFLELMEEQITNKKLLKFIQNAKQSAEFINTLTDSILERVKYENEVRTSEVENVHTIAFFSGIANIFSANMTSKGIHYLVKIDPSIPKEIKIEKVKFKRILINLIGNAYKFTPAGKSIELNITYLPKKNRIHVEVNDQGLGIEEERQAEIFKAFEQAKDDTSIHYGGTGLGLAICSKYVEDLGGTLELKSELDKGSSFFFDIKVDTTDQSAIYSPFQVVDHKITICTDNRLCIDANYMKSYLVQLGIPEENIVISDQIEEDTTHLICFEHKLDESVLDLAKKHNMKLALFEEKLFSLSKQEKYEDYPIMSKNNYYTDVLYSFVSSKRKPKILIVDDNKLNIQLLESIFEGEYCEIESRYDGEEGLIILQEALVKGQPFDIVLSDKNMPGISGLEMLKAYRDIENGKGLEKRIFAVSITGDEQTDADRKLYDLVLQKPFKGEAIKKVLSQA